MSEATIDPRLTVPRAAPRKKMTLSWSDPKFRALVWQILIVGLVAAIVWYLSANTSRNLAARRIATGFAFLSRNAGIPIGESPIPYDPAVSTYGSALVIGILNTLKVAVVAIVLSTLLGTAIGIARLSHNWLIARIAIAYVEFLRGLPLLLQLLFWYTLLQTLPGPKQSFTLGATVFLSNRGFRLPLLNWESAHSWALLGLVVACILTYLYSRRAARLQAATGVRPKVLPVAIALLVGIPAAIWMLFGAPFIWDFPVLRGFNFQGGGTLSPEYAALLIGLSTYTAAYVAEIVRSGIQSVPAGQWEAAAALGLSRGQTLRRIVLPQALRVIIPPMTSQYLNVTKNSSLAVAIGYQDVVSIANTTLNQTGQAIEGIAYIMVVYLAISLSISLFMNWYNARIALVER